MGKIHLFCTFLFAVTKATSGKEKGLLLACGLRVMVGSMGRLITAHQSLGLTQTSAHFVFPPHWNRSTNTLTDTLRALLSPR